MTKEAEKPEGLPNALNLSHAEYMAQRYGARHGTAGSDGHLHTEAVKERMDAEIRGRDAQPPPDKLPNALAMSDEEYRKERYGKRF